MSQIVASRPMFIEMSESSGVLTSSREKQSTEHNSYYEKIFLAELRQSTRKTDEYGRKRNAVDVKKSLKQLIIKLDSDISPEVILADFILSEFNQGSWKAPSTALRFISNIGRAWLQVTRQCDLISHDEGAMSEVYSELVNLREKRDQRAIDDLNKFFIFINSSYSLPLPENMETSGRQQAHVRSTTVNETAFLQLIEDLPKLFPNESPHTIKQLHLMLILMRRVGLRPFEVVKLKL